MSIASDTSVVEVKKPVIYGDPNVYNWSIEKYVPDEWATAGAIAGNYQNAAENSYAAAISGLQSLLNSLGGADGSTSTSTTSVKLGDVQDSLFDVYGSLGDLKTQYGGAYNEINGLIDNIGAIGQKVNPVYDRLSGINSTLDEIYGNLGGNYSILEGVRDSLSGIAGSLGPLAGEGADIQGFLDAATGNAAMMNQYAELAKQSASGITNQVNSVNNTAGQIQNVAESLTPYSANLTNMGNEMFATGGGLIDTGNGILGNAQALLNMDASGGGLIAEYINSINAIDPNRYVSMAATDVTSAYAQSRDQQNRALARSGVDAGSVRSIALDQAHRQSEATALAAAKFLSGKEPGMYDMSDVIG